MTEQVNVYEAKTHLSKLLERVEAGEEIIIARNGRPVARLVPTQRERAPRVPGGWKGRVWMADDFDDPGGEYQAMIDEMYRNPIEPEEFDAGKAEQT
ncbi:MAG: type II toxin-antitoxin system Phd/YefM family antitoxin [Pseudonocardia sp.]|nr:type II toxin-antitoxin system Phd/YefM family antitoxin [Pseudonocardia sp.]